MCLLIRHRIGASATGVPVILTKGVRIVTQNRKSHGFSIIELLVVMVIMLVLAGFSIYMLNGKELYNTDDQAYTVMDVLKEARQRAITQREIMRVEINRDVGQI